MQNNKNGKKLISLIEPLGEKKLIPLIEPLGEKKLIPLIEPLEKQEPMQEIFSKEHVKQEEIRSLRHRKVFEEEKKRMLEMPKKEVNVQIDDEEETYGNFSIQILKRVKIIEEFQDEIKISTKYRCKIILNNGELMEVSVPGTQIHNLNWIIEKSGGAAHFSTNKSARDEIAKQIHMWMDSGDVESITKYQQNGWKKIEGYWEYVIDSGVVGTQIEKIIGDETHPFLYDPTQVATQKNFREVFGMLDICKDRTITTALFLFTHMGILTKLFEIAKVPVKGMLAVIGPTNSRKTSLALCMTKTFCRDDIFTPEISFESTLGGIEVETSRHADSVVVIDDFHPSMTKKNQNKMNDLLEFVVRRYGDRTVKKRMTDFAPNGNAGKYGIKGLAVITGEDIGGVQSSLTRILCLEITRNTVNNEVLSFYQDNPYILTSHLYGFIAYVSRYFNEIVSYLAKRVKELRKQKKSDVPRFSEYYAQMMVVGEIIAEYAVYQSFWNSKDVAYWLSDCGNALNSIVMTNLKNVRAGDFSTMIAIALNDALKTNGVEKIEKANGQIGNLQILKDSEFYYIRAEFLLEITKKYWSRFGQDLPFASKKQMTMFLKNAGLILTKKEGTELRYTLPLPGGKQRVLYLKKRRLKEILEETEL